MKFSRLIAILVFLNVIGTAPIRGENRNQEENVNSNTPVKKAKVRLLMSIIWEGSQISNYNVQAIAKFRELYPNVAFTHFISPSYFLRPSAKSQKSDLLRQLIRPQDKIALYMQPWKSLTEEADVIFRNRPTFWGAAVSPQECSSDCGMQVPLSIYDGRDLDSLFATSVKIMHKQGFSEIHGYLNAGWVSSDAIVESALASGLREDYSIMDAELVAEKLSGFPILQWIRASWPKISAPRETKTLKTRLGSMRQIMHTPGIIDYHSVESAVQISDEVLEAALEKPRLDWVLHFSVIQESASQNVDRLKSIIPKIVALARQKNVLLLQFHEKVLFSK